MTAFPAPQRAALTRLREAHPHARISVPTPGHQPFRPALRVILRWSAYPTDRRRDAYVYPDGRIIVIRGRGGRDRQAVPA